MTIEELLPNVNPRFSDCGVEGVKDYAAKIEQALKEHSLDGSLVKELRFPLLMPDKDPNGRPYDKVLALHAWNKYTLVIHVNSDGWISEVANSPGVQFRRGQYHKATA